MIPPDVYVAISKGAVWCGAVWCGAVAVAVAVLMRLSSKATITGSECGRAWGLRG